MSPTMYFLLMKLSYLGPQAISRDDYWFFILDRWVRNHNLGVKKSQIVNLEGVPWGDHPLNRAPVNRVYYRGPIVQEPRGALDCATN